jgi:hypothetical protein
VLGSIGRERAGARLGHEVDVWLGRTVGDWSS